MHHSIIKVKYEDAFELYCEAIALFSSSDGAQHPGSATHLLTLLNSNAAECALKLGRWHAAIQLSDAALMNSASHQKSAARKTRAELALMLHNSLSQSPAAEQLDGFTSVEVQRAVRTLSQLLLPDLFDKMTRKFSLYSVGTASANADPLSTVAQRIDDRNVDLMLEMRPSLYDAMHQIILEEIDQTAHRQCRPWTRACQSFTLPAFATICSASPCAASRLTIQFIQQLHSSTPSAASDSSKQE